MQKGAGEGHRDSAGGVGASSGRAAGESAGRLGDELALPPQF